MPSRSGGRAGVAPGGRARRAGVAPGGPGGRGRGLAARTVLVTCVVALLSVVVTALVAVPVAVRGAKQEARESLVHETELVASLISIRAGDGAALTRRLRSRGMDIYLVIDGRPDRPGLPAQSIETLSAGRPVGPRLARVHGRLRLVAGRQIPDRAGSAVVLTADPVTGTASAVLRRLWLALLAGLLAGLAAGPLLARRLARPIRRAAHAASQLSSGDRTVRLPIAGPAEVAELAEAINALATALATSEGRQRDFLLSVSHELRTPLTTIRGYAEALTDGVVGPDGAQRAGHTMLAEAERLDRLITDLLVLARLEADEMPIELISVDLGQLVSAAGEAWGGRCAAAGVILRIEPPSAAARVHTDPGRIRQIIDGLLENALRVVPPGAPIVLATRAPGIPGAPGPGSEPGVPGQAVVEVRDGGPGFTDDDLAVAFERGELHRRYQGIRTVGSGLGLALAARLSRRLGGSIQAGHAPEGGARFTISLPLTNPEHHLDGTSAPVADGWRDTGNTSQPDIRTPSRRTP